MALARPGFGAKIGGVFKTLGSKAACLYLLSRLCGKLRLPLTIYSYRLVAQPVAAYPRLTGTRGDSFEAREILPDDPALAEMPLEAETVAFRFGQGAHCLGLFRGKALAGYIWLILGPFEEDEVRCRFVPLPAARASWDFDIYVLPTYRLSPVFPKLWDVADAFLRERGIAWSCSRVSAFNLTSVRSHARLGALDLGGADFLVAGPVQLMLSGQAPWVHLAMTRGARPRLQVDTAKAESAARDAMTGSHSVARQVDSPDRR